MMVFPVCLPLVVASTQIMIRLFAQGQDLTGHDLGLLAFLDVPLVYLSVRMMPDIHPISVNPAPQMKLTLAVWFVPMTMLTLGLIAFLYRTTRRRTLLRELDQSTAQANAA